MKKLRKAYRIACIAFGKKKTHAFIALIAAAAAYAVLQSTGIGASILENSTVRQEALPFFQKTAGGILDNGLNDPAQIPGISDDVETAVVTKITDGDTITVEMNGQKFKVRMLEVDTPESVHADQSKNNEFGETASDFTKTHLTVGQTVYLTKDTSNTDRFGRLLRLVWTEEPDDPFDEVELRTKCYNAKLLLDGYAEVAIFDDNSYQEIFTEFQKEAMNDRRGLWADSAWWEFKGLEGKNHE